MATRWKICFLFNLSGNSSLADIRDDPRRLPMRRYFDSVQRHLQNGGR
jgi:hypothetical protein